MIIFVSDSRNRVLAPTVKMKWVNKMIRERKARFIKGPILRIQLTYPVLEDARDTDTYYSIGIDSGYQQVGFTVLKVSKTTCSKLLFGEVELRTSEIKELLTERKMYRQARRRHRRNRANSMKFRHPRWKNRKNKEKLTPTVRHLIQSHVNIINKIFKYIPRESSRINLEYFKVDKSVINKPGSKSSFTNMRYFIMARDNYTCKQCGAKNVPFQVHHKIERNQGGTNVPNNLVTLCKNCHDKHHKGKINANLLSTKRTKRKKSGRASGVLNTTMPYIYKELAKEIPTYKYFGYETFDAREKLKLSKSHANDALTLALFDVDTSLKYKDFNIKELDIKQIRRHASRAKTDKLLERTYRIYHFDPRSSPVARNRNKRTKQEEKSLADFRRLGKIIPSYRLKLKVTPGGRQYRQDVIDFNPGELVRNLRTKESFIVRGNGAGYKVYGFHKQTSPRQDPKAKNPQSTTITLKRNSGLVII